MPSLPPDVVKDWRIFQLCCVAVLIGLFALIKCYHVDCRRDRCVCDYQNAVETEAVALTAE